MRKLAYTIFMAMLLVAASATAQNYEVQPPREDKVAVGAIGGTVDVTALGGASYTIPIQVPEGIGGMQPNLSVVYNSQSGNGLLGWGWNLGGLSAITRVGQTDYHDGRVTGVSLDYHDRFALDGQRLMVLDGATYGSDNAEYRTEVDGMSKIVSYTETIHGGSDLYGQAGYEYEIISHFKVFTPDGRIMYYGKVDNEPDNARVMYESEGKKIVVMWLLKRVEDRMGNYMVYNYEIGGHDYRLSNIQYCANSHARDANEPDRGTKYGIGFQYKKKDRVDKESMAIGNYILYQPWLLERISIYHWSQPLSSYRFVYDNNSGQLDTHNYYNRNYYNRLKQIHYEYEGRFYHPTTIEWGDCPVGINNPNFYDCHDHYLTSVSYLDVSSLESQFPIQNNVKFSGDFNGDGFSDLIVVEKPRRADSCDLPNVDSIQRKKVKRPMHVYLNEGHGKSDGNPGTANFRIAEVTLSGSQTNTIYLTNVDWIYVCDFNGDGLDDIVTFGQHLSYLGLQKTVAVEAFKSVILEDGTWTLERILFDGVHVGGFLLCWPTWFIDIGARQSATLLTGDFCGRNRDDLIVARNSGHSRKFYYLSYDEETNQFYFHESAADWKAVTYATCDYDGDGKTEVWFADEGQPGKLVKLYLNSDGKYTYYQIRQCFDSNCKLFTGDFNGDGCSDFLAFHAKRQTEGWEIVLGGAESNDLSYDVSTIMNNCTGIADPGDYSYDFEIRERENNLKYYMGVVDVDGDGKTDIVVRNNEGETSVLYAPLRKTNGVASFANITRDNSSEIGFNGEQTYGICVGNFLGQENTSILQNKMILSSPQHSTYYNVKSVTDGMGNRVAFDYGYLVHNPMKPDNIYDVDRLGQNRGLDLYSVPLPMKAVRTLTTSNINVPEQAQSVDLFSYSNLIVHRKGKGILGFVGITRDSWHGDPTQDTPETKHKSKLVRAFNYKPMEQHRALVPEGEMLYRYKDSGEEVLTSSTFYNYAKGLCQRDMNSLGIKVFTPLVKTTLADEYELLGERGRLRRRITENDYDGQQQNSLYAYYNQAIRVTETRQGTDAGTTLTVSGCEFQTLTHTEYAELLNSGDLWMPNRPFSVYTESTRRTPGYADAKSLALYYYDPDRLYLPMYVNTYPSGVEDQNDPLAMTAYYTYHPTGRLKDESHYPVVGRSEDGFKTMYGYSPDNRFLMTKTEEYDLTHTNDYVTSYAYDDIYGDLRTETDCNGYSTCHENPDHLGLTVRSYRRDNDENRTRIAGTETVTALRRLEGSAYQGHGEGLRSPYYFTWKRSSGGTEALTIYDALGRELRTVTHGLPENGTDKIVYKDTQYDKWGRLQQVSEPYFMGLPMERRKWTTYTYGDFDRMDTSYGIEYTVDGQPIQPYTRYEYDGLTTTTTSGVVDGTETHVTATTLNIMGWTESNVEVIDGNGTENTTTYGYNADGSLAWSMVNNNEATKISVLYDDAGNRRELTDPNYGTVTDHYNAFGQLDYTVSPKGDVTAYEYDNLGRMKTRTETCHSNPGEPERLTTWNYSETPGKKGLLDGIELKEGEIATQTIAYAYDMQRYNRLTSKTETLLGTPYTTSYAYDDRYGHPLRLKATTYPTGYTMTRDYDAMTGRLRQLRHGSTVLWRTETENALGQITRYTTGNGAVTDIAYDERHLLENQATAVAGNILQDFSYDYDIFANLAARKDNKRNLEETFTYDHLNRLTDIRLNGVPTGHMAYDALGRMTSKRTDGQQVFSSAQHDYVGPDGQLRPHAISSATVEDNPFPTAQLDIDYTMFDKVGTITQPYNNGLYTLSYAYGYNHQRRRIVENYGNAVFRKKIYGDHCEFVTENSYNSSSTFLTGPLGVFAVVEKKNGSDRLHYVYKDHLGSWTMITDARGNIEQEVSFDAWGNLRDPETWSGEYNGTLMFDRGFTGHEHLMFGQLINMNGRMYDPIMSSFLSVDNYVQAPDFSQSFNRYAYCLNNPLKYTDPDGEWFLTGGVGFGKREDGTYGLTSVSVGVNFGYFGFGVNLGFDNRGFSSFGVYGELGPHVGSAGANLTLSVGYDFRYQTTTASLSAGYGFSYGIGRAGVGASGSYTWGGPSGVSPWNANVSASLGLAGSVNKFGQMAGLGIGCSYGTQGWGFGAHSYCEILPLQEKLDRIVNYYNTEIAAVGENDASFKVGSNHNLSEINQEIYGDIYDNNGEINRAGHDNYGITVPGNLRVGRRIKGTTIYLSKNTIKKIWNGSDYFKEVMLHECQHASDFYTGEYQRYGYSERAIRAHMESRAYMGNYYRTGNTEYLNLAAPYLRCVPTPNLKPINVFSL